MTNQSLANLEYDSQKNHLEIYGPYVKYNVLKPPYSLGKFQLDLNDVRLTKEGSSFEFQVIWPQFMMEFGRVRLIDDSGRVLLDEQISEGEATLDGKMASYKLDESGEGLATSLSSPFRICLDQTFNESFVKVCSNTMMYNDGLFKPVNPNQLSSQATLNGKKAPKNAQISLDPKTPFYELNFKFKSGFSFQVKDQFRKLSIEQVIVDPKKKQLGIINNKGQVRATQLTLKDQLFSWIKEQNYYKNQYLASQEWPEDLVNSEMEFVPYKTGASMQLYGLIVPATPPPFQFKIDDSAPLATYSEYVELKGTKLVSEKLAAKNKNELFIQDDDQGFLWNFPTPNISGINQRYISLQHKGKDYFFSKRVFRAHQSSIAASAALSTTTTLGIVPGYNFSAEHWFEEIWGKGSWSYQRWGVAANIYETIQPFQPSKDSVEKISVNPITAELQFRFTPGVRPVQSTFGLGVRYLNFRLFRSRSPNTETQLFGIGGFWQTAPQKVVDDVFNIVPFFRYPKWMELSFYYYPLGLGVLDMGFSFSWQAKGKMFFSKGWYMELSFNVNSVSLTKITNGRTDSFAIGTAHGTMGVGYLF